MSPDYTLGPDERVVLKGESGAYHGQRARVASSVELMLTNRNIVVTAIGLLGKAKGHQCFPLDQVKVVDGLPQVRMEGNNPPNLLEVYFVSGVETFGFARKKELKEWASATTELVTGAAGDAKPVRHRAIPGAAFVASSVKDTVLTFSDSWKRKPKEVTGSCSACGASISGAKKQVATCQFCGSDHQL